MEIRELDELMKNAGFPDEARVSLTEDYKKLLGYPASAKLLEDCRRRFEEGEKYSFYRASEELQTMKEQTQVHPFASDMLFYLHLAPVLRAEYKKRGIPEKWFWGAMEDLRCKLYECDAVYHIWGSFVAVWFSRFYDFSLYAIGRLEFCLISAMFDYEKDGLSIKKGQKCIDVHIPSKGKLVRKELEESYKEAAKFFAPKLEAPIAFECESWLLFEHHREMLKENSGIRMFANDYTYLSSAPDEGDLWRIFGDEDTDKPETLSEDTSLKKAYKQWLIEKKPVYGGIGMFFLDHFKA